jgi:signal transduction histidine kinase
VNRRSLLLLLVAGVLLAAVWAWLGADYRRRVADRRAAHDHLVTTVLAAADGALFRECRGGRYDPGELTAALAALCERTGARRLAVMTEGGETLAGFGQRSEGSGGTERVTREFSPPRPRGGGRGQKRPGANLIPVPAGRLELVMEYPRDRLDAEISDEWQRMLQVGIGASAAIALAVLAAWLGLRSAALRERLAASREKVRALDYLGRLGAGLAHETKNPLGVVRGFGERLERADLPDEERRTAARAILSETDRAVARLDEFLLLSRPSELRREECGLDGLVAEVATLLDPDVEAKRATLDVSGVTGNVSADREQVRRLLLNLLLNAVAAIDERGRVEVRTEVREGGLRLVVEDDGAGVPEELRESLFEPYVTGRPGGTGLGLSIARRIALDHGWRLDHEGGSRFVLEIPDA